MAQVISHYSASHWRSMQEREIDTKALLKSVFIKPMRTWGCEMMMKIRHALYVSDVIYSLPFNISRCRNIFRLFCMRWWEKKLKSGLNLSATELWDLRRKRNSRTHTLTWLWWIIMKILWRKRFYRFASKRIWIRQRLLVCLLWWLVQDLYVWWWQERFQIVQKKIVDRLMD